MLCFYDFSPDIDDVNEELSDPNPVPEASKIGSPSKPDLNKFKDKEQCLSYKSQSEHRDLDRYDVGV